MCKEGGKARRTLSLRVRQRTGWTVDFSELHSEPGKPHRAGQGRHRRQRHEFIPVHPSFLPSFPPLHRAARNTVRCQSNQEELTCALPFKGFIVYPLVSGDDCRAIVFKSHPLGRRKEKGNESVKSHPWDGGKGKDKGERYS